jgi:type III secretion system FlhB-like substrate exporter
MKPYCLIKEKADEFVKRLQNGEISPMKMDAMSSSQRREFLQSFLGDDAKKVNLLYEQKSLNKNREQGLISWAEQISGKNTKQREALVQKIKANSEERLKKIFSPEDDKAFLAELAEQRLGIGISSEESETIFKLAKKYQDTKDLFNKNKIYSKLEEIKGSLSGKDKEIVDGLFSRLEDVKIRKKETSQSLIRIKRYLGEGASESVKKDIGKLVDDIVSARNEKGVAYGASKVALDEYIGEIKLGIKNPRTILSTIKDIASFAKSVKASVDNSFIGRQGLKTLFSGHPIVWLKSFGESFKLLYKAGIKGEDAVKGLRAEILSRENSRNGLYEKLKLAIGMSEEAYPTNLPEKIPLFGRVFKGSEQAFTGSAYRMRADLADALIKKALKQGVDLNDKMQAEALGELINSMTGRGRIKGLSEGWQEGLNVGLFSPKYLKSQLDTVGHIFTGAGGSNFVRKEAAKNLAGIVSSIGAILFISSKLQPGSVEWDPRSSDFGKIKIGNTRFDITGGLSSLVVLASRIITRSSKSTNGNITKMGDYGSKDATGLAGDFLENKTSPIIRLISDIYAGENFDKEPSGWEALKNQPAKTLWTLGRGFAEPIPVGNAIDAWKNRETEPALAAIILDGFGIGANIYTTKENWNGKTTIEMQKFKEKVGYDKFNEANDEFNKQINGKLEELKKKKEFIDASAEDKAKKLDKEKEGLKKSVFSKYNFTPPKS